VRYARAARQRAGGGRVGKAESGPADSLGHAEGEDASRRRRDEGSARRDHATRRWCARPNAISPAEAIMMARARKPGTKARGEAARPRPAPQSDTSMTFPLQPIYITPDRRKGGGGTAPTYFGPTVGRVPTKHVAGKL